MSDGTTIASVCSFSAPATGHAPTNQAQISDSIPVVRSRMAADSVTGDRKVLVTTRPGWSISTSRRSRTSSSTARRC